MKIPVKYTMKFHNNEAKICQSGVCEKSLKFMITISLHNYVQTYSNQVHTQNLTYNYNYTIIIYTNLNINLN